MHLLSLWAYNSLTPQKGLNKLLQPELVNRLEAVGREGRGKAGEQEAV